MSSLRLCIYIIKTFSLHPGYFVSFHFFVTASPLYFISARHHSFHCNDDRIVTKKKEKKRKQIGKQIFGLFVYYFFAAFSVWDLYLHLVFPCNLISGVAIKQCIVIEIDGVWVELEVWWSGMLVVDDNILSLKLVRWWLSVCWHYRKLNLSVLSVLLCNYWKP